MKLCFFEEVDSTNEYLKREYPKLEDMTLVYTNHQTSGKGRLGRSWSDYSESLLLSILIKEEIAPDKIELLPLLCGVCLHLSLYDFGIRNTIKWPNDILIGDKKCAGILLESIYKEKLEALIIGIGINVNNSSFPDELKNKACSLKMILNHDINKKKLLQVFIHHFETLYESFRKNDYSFLEILRSNSYLDGREVYLNYYGENRHCRVLGINDDGSLKVRDENDKTYDMKSGEVTLEKNYRCISQPKL